MNFFPNGLSVALWFAGMGHFCLLFASAQVPSRLGWKKDLAQLTVFNRKLMWVYAGTTLLTIIAFGTLTFVLHDAFLARDHSAVALAVFMAVFWTLRIIVDFVYLRHTDWPQGVIFIFGHVLLVGLFIALASTYWLVLIWSFHP
jgi:alginate O-acetyltransferase complex protein AlgI